MLRRLDHHRPWRVLLPLLILSVGGGAWAVHSWGTADPEALVRQAEADMEARRFDRAEAAVRRLGRLRAPTAEDWRLRARVATARGQLEKALEAWAQIPDSHPVAAEARLRSGQIELRRHRVRMAEAAFLRALGINPGLIQARRELVYIYGMQLRRDALRAQYEALARLMPLTFEEVFLWCLTRNNTWNAEEQIGTLERFLAADPDDRQTRLALAQTLVQLGRHDEVDAVLGALPAADPEARAVRARSALDRGDVAAAAALLGEGPADHPELARLRGRLALARRDGPAAVRHFRAALATLPDDRDVLSGLGAALRMVGDRAAAEPVLQASRNLDILGGLVQRAGSPANRNDPRLLHDLGAACEAVGRLPEARAWYQLAIARDPLDRESQHALFRLEAADPRSKPKG
jgi:tetratricopeptide (TPR) repeat protein